MLFSGLPPPFGRWPGATSSGSCSWWWLCPAGAGSPSPRSPAQVEEVWFSYPALHWAGLLPAWLSSWAKIFSMILLKEKICECKQFSLNCIQFWIWYNFLGEYQRFKMEYLPLKREDNSLYICVFSQSVFPKSVSISVFLKIVFFSPKVYLPKKYFPKCIFQKHIFWKWYFPKIYFPKFIFWTCVYESVFSKSLFPRRPWWPR